jgi:hypothetical protein
LRQAAHITGRHTGRNNTVVGLIPDASGQRSGAEPLTHERGARADAANPDP